MDIKVVRSSKRKKTVSARLVDGVLKISAPACLSDDELKPIIARLQKRIEKKQKKDRLDDTELRAIAKRLNAKYFQNRLEGMTISWSTNQDKRYGSCTPAHKSIRISHRIAAMPQFVKEYVVMHELAHLVEANHSEKFWRLVNRYPLTERARGYLIAVGLEGLDESPADILRD